MVSVKAQKEKEKKKKENLAAARATNKAAGLRSNGAPLDNGEVLKARVAKAEATGLNVAALLATMREGGALDLSQLLARLRHETEAYLRALASMFACRARVLQLLATAAADGVAHALRPGGGLVDDAAEADLFDALSCFRTLEGCDILGGAAGGFLYDRDPEDTSDAAALQRVQLERSRLN